MLFFTSLPNPKSYSFVRVSRGPSRHLITPNGDRQREICLLTNPVWVLALRTPDFRPQTPSQLRLKRRRWGFRRFGSIGKPLASFYPFYARNNSVWNQENKKRREKQSRKKSQSRIITSLIFWLLFSMCVYCLKRNPFTIETNRLYS